MPSTALRAGTFAGVVAIFSTVTTLVLGEFNLVGGGLIPLLVFFMLMGIPSRELVGDVVSIIRHHVGSADQAEHLKTRQWEFGLVGGCVLLLVVAASMFFWLESSPTQISPPPQMEKAAERDPVSGITSNTASLLAPTNPRVEYSVVAGMGGRIDFLHPDLAPGSVFKKDTVVARIDAQDLQDSMSRLTAELQAYEAEKARLDDEYQWLADLRQVQSLSQQQVEDLQAEAVSLSERHLMTIAQTNELKRALKSLRAKIARTEVKMPARMRIDQVNVTVNEYVSPNQELIKGTRAQ